MYFGQFFRLPVRAPLVVLLLSGCTAGPAGSTLDAGLPLLAGAPPGASTNLAQVLHAPAPHAITLQPVGGDIWPALTVAPPTSLLLLRQQSAAQAAQARASGRKPKARGYGACTTRAGRNLGICS